jgi:pimeloyl-ACP methyl ester carboxylesterase
VAAAHAGGGARRAARGREVSHGVTERSVRVNGLDCRVWEKGEGEPLGFLAGLGGLLRWTPFLERLAERHRVVAPSLPGFPGALGHDRLDTHLDWITAALDLLDASGLRGADLVGASVGGSLAAEAAALSPRCVRRLVLIAPFGLFDEREPVADIWAQRPGEGSGLLCSAPERLEELLAPPEGEDPIEWQILQVRASEAAARLLWPTTDTGLARRLHRIEAPTLLLWGSEDRVVPASYAKRFADAIGRNARVRSLPGAGHAADIDAPDAAADAVLGFVA